MTIPEIVLETMTTRVVFNTIGRVVAMGVSEDVYMRDYAEFFCEWVDGTVINLSPVHDKHDEITRYLAILLEAYFELRPIGEIRQEPFVLRLPIEQEGPQKYHYREPDIQIILSGNQHRLKPTYMDGPADIVIEVVSTECIARDYGEKYHEYEQVGVPEYWIIDPLKKECRFYQRNARHAYVLQDVEDEYQTAQLPGLIVHVPTLWQDNLPGPIAIGKAVQAMLEA